MFFFFKKLLKEGGTFYFSIICPTDYVIFLIIAENIAKPERNMICASICWQSTGFGFILYGKRRKTGYEGFDPSLFMIKIEDRLKLEEIYSIGVLKEE